MSTICRKEFLKIKSISDFNGNITVAEIEGALDCSNTHARVYKALIENNDELEHIFGDVDIIKENTKLAKKTQRFMDLNRVERKTFRDKTRIENTLISFNEAIIENFSKINFNIRRNPKNNLKIIGGNQAIIQLADTHFNELVDLDINNYDFEIAGKRLQKYAHEVKVTLRPLGVKKVILAMTGDLLNSDRRLDEKMAMATNRMNAAMVGANLIQYFIQDLMEEFEQMDVFYVTGNESRSFELGWVDIVATDNYDSLIFNMLKKLYEPHRHVRFFNTNPIETVIKVNGKNILLIHGTTLGPTPDGKLNKIYSKYAAKGINLSYSLFGHLHSTMITDIFARSASLVGGNTYSDLALGFASSASQNLTIVQSDGTINCQKIDLQKYDYFEGYNIQSDLDLYNIKSASKMHRDYRVIEVKKY